MAGRVLLELTEFQAHRRTYRHLSGVPRTVAEIGRRLVADSQVDVECMYYDTAANAFYAADANLLHERDYGSSPTGAVQKPGLRAQLRRILRAARSRISRLGTPRSTAARGARRIFATVRGRRRIKFGAGDIVLQLGSAWSTPTLREALQHEKQHVDFGVVSLVYDLIPVWYPQLYGSGFATEYRAYLADTITVSDRLLVISRATETDLVRYCSAEHISLPPTEVVHLGDTFQRSETAWRPEGVPDDGFVLAVSTVEPRKNHRVLYEAVKQAQIDGLELPPIVIAGNPGWMTDELQAALTRDPSIATSLMWLHPVSDAELAWLYEHAGFTVYPSIAEGWGLPIAESLAFGKFCIASDASSMPEVGGDLVDYCSPFDPVDWARAIHRYGSDRALLEARSARIRAEYRPRTWETAAATIKAAMLRH